MANTITCEREIGDPGGGRRLSSSSLGRDTGRRTEKGGKPALEWKEERAMMERKEDEVLYCALAPSPRNVRSRCVNVTFQSYFIMEWDDERPHVYSISQTINAFVIPTSS